MKFGGKKMKNRLNNIQIMRIIACFGVFFGHFAGMTFPSEQLNLLLGHLRSGFLSVTPVAWFTMGDLDVLFFFAAGGFFLSYTFNDTANWKTAAVKLAERLCTLFIPAILITLVFAGLKIWSTNDFQGVKAELVVDLIRILRGTCNGSFEPTLSYQLWYIHFMARGCVFGLCFNYLFRKNKYLRISLLCLLIPLLWWKNMNGIWQVAIGMLAGNIVKDTAINNIPAKREMFAALCLVILTVVPCISQIGGIGHNLIAMLLLGLFLVFDAIAEQGTNQSQPSFFMRFLERNNYSFYLLHVLTLSFIARPAYNWMTVSLGWNENIVLQLCFWGTVIITLALSELFSRYFLSLFKFSRRIAKKPE